MTSLFFWFLRDAFSSRSALLVENLALRQQVAAFKAASLHPRIRPRDRLFWRALRRLWSRWEGVLLFVQPESVVRWHRAGFRAYWAWISRKGKKEGHSDPRAEIRRLVQQMARENPTWGAPRIHGELLALGFKVSERSISRYLPKRPVAPDTVERWKAFLRNHAEGLAAMDFFTVPTVSFRMLYVLFVLHHASRRILHFAVTDHPTAAWVCQQLREAFPYDTAPKYLLFDRDSIFTTEVILTIRHMGTTPVRSAYRCPWQNPYAERWVGSARRDALDQVVIFGEGHLRKVLVEYLGYYHADRTHLGLGKRTPAGRPVERRPSSEAIVLSFPRVGGRRSGCHARILRHRLPKGAATATASLPLHPTGPYSTFRPHLAARIA